MQRSKLKRLKSCMGSTWSRQLSCEMQLKALRISLVIHSTLKLSWRMNSWLSMGSSVETSRTSQLRYRTLNQQVSKQSKNSLVTGTTLVEHATELSQTSVNTAKDHPSYPKSHQLPSNHWVALQSFTDVEALRMQSITRRSHPSSCRDKCLHHWAMCKCQPNCHHDTQLVVSNNSINRHSQTYCRNL